MFMKKCKLENCERKHHAKKLCKLHYNMMLRQDEYISKKRRCCSVENCERMHFAKGYCNRHYQSFLYRRTITPIYLLPGEEWKKIKKISKTSYFISNFGRVKSERSTKTKNINSSRILKPQIDPNDGGLRIVLGNNDVFSCIRIAISVARAFLPNKTNSTRVKYLDGNKQNCRVDNLIWERELILQKNLPILIKQKENNPEVMMVLRYFNGDKTAIETLLEGLYPKIFYHVKRVCHRYYMNTIDTDSVVQNTMIKVSMALKRGLWKPDTALVAWVKTICHNEVINYYQKIKNETSLYRQNRDGKYFDITNKLVHKQWREDCAC